jgi:hypothetical protein
MSTFRLAKVYWPVSLPAIALLMVSLPEKMVYGASSGGQPHLQFETSSSAVPDAFSRLIFLAFAESSPQAVFLVGLSLVLIAFSLLPLASALFGRKSTRFKRLTNLLKSALHLLAGCSLFTVVVFSGANRWYVASAFDEILDDSGLVPWRSSIEGDSFGASGPVSKLLADLRGESHSFAYPSGSSASAQDTAPLLQGATCGTIAPQGAELLESSSSSADDQNSELKFGLELEVR